MRTFWLGRRRLSRVCVCAAADTTHERIQLAGGRTALAVWARQADLAELADWVDGLRAAADIARAQGKIRLAEALDVIRFDVYEG
jgi:hypothetical protein